MLRILTIPIFLLMGSPVVAQDVSPALQRYIDMEPAMVNTVFKPVNPPPYRMAYSCILPKSSSQNVAVTPADGPAGPLEQRPVFSRQEPLPWSISEEFGFFCRWEWKVEKKSGIAPRFRLGSWEEAQRLEYGRQ